MMPSLWIAQPWPIHFSESEDVEKLLVYCLVNLPKDRDIAMRKLMLYYYLTIKWRGFHMLQALNAKGICSMNTRLSISWDISMIIKDPYERKNARVQQV